MSIIREKIRVEPAPGRKTKSGAPVTRTCYRTTFETLADFQRHVAENADAMFKSRSWPRDSWAGGDKQETLDLIAQGGSEAEADTVREFINQLTIPDITSYKDEAVLDVAGGTPCIAAFVSGDPFSMINVQNVHSDRGTVRIVFDTISSAGVEEEVLRRCGSAVMALAQTLSQLRPVEVYYCVGADSRGKDGAFYRVKLSTPFSLAEAGLLLGKYSITRGVIFSLATLEHGFRGTWAYGGTGQGSYGYGNANTSSKQSNLDLVDENTVFIPPVTLHDTIAQDPVKWVQQALDHVLTDNVLKDGYAQADF